MALAAFAATTTGVSGARAQTGKDGASPARPAAQPQTGESPSAANQSQAESSPQVRRAQAYTKLLEGQRYFAGARTGNLTVESLRRAQAAFQQAAELDPLLAEAHTALAEISLFFDDLQQAEHEGQAAARISPDNVGAHRILSRVYTVKSRLAEGSLDRAFADKAVAELREVTRVGPNDAEAWALLAEFYVATAREKEAIEALREWATLPASIEGRFYQLVTKGRDLTPDAANARLGEVLLRAGRPAEAIAALRQAIAIEPDNTRYLALLGEALEAGGGADQGVINELRRIVAQQPQNAAAISMLARAESRAGRVDDAAATLRSGIAAAAHPGSESARLNLQLQLADTFDTASRYEDSIAVYEDLLKSRNVKDTPLATERERKFAVAALASILNLRQRAGQPEEALATVERMRRLLPNSDPTADIEKVNLLRSLGRHDEALAAARSARQRLPEELSLLRLEAYTLVDLGRVEEATGLFRQRLKGAPSDYDEYAMITSLLIGAGRGGEAVQAARKALELAPADDPGRTTGALLLLSSAQERAGDAKGAVETLQQVLAKDPENATALNNLGYFLTEHDERLNEALGMIQRAVNAQPTNPSFLDSLGWIHFKLGKLKEAERYLNDAARRNPTSAAIQEHLGDLFQRLGQQEKAQSSWRKALSLAVESADTSRIRAKLNGETNK
jgi:tetratricopeptide (TPR) repeat protein